MATLTTLSWSALVEASVGGGPGHRVTVAQGRRGWRGRGRASGRSPRRRLPSERSCIASHPECPQTAIVCHRQAFDRVARAPTPPTRRPSPGTRLPTLRTLSSSPGPLSVIRFGRIRASAHVSSIVCGPWSSVRCRHPLAQQRRDPVAEPVDAAGELRRPDQAERRASPRGPRCRAAAAGASGEVHSGRAGFGHRAPRRRASRRCRIHSWRCLVGGVVEVVDVQVDETSAPLGNRASAAVSRGQREEAARAGDRDVPARAAVGRPFGERPRRIDAHPDDPPRRDADGQHQSDQHALRAG